MEVPLYNLYFTDILQWEENFFFFEDNTYSRVEDKPMQGESKVKVRFNREEW